MGETTKVTLFWFSFLMQRMYEGPEYLVEKMKSLSLSQDCSLGGEIRFRVEPPRLNTDRSAGRRGKHQSLGLCPDLCCGTNRSLSSGFGSFAFVSGILSDKHRQPRELGFRLSKLFPIA